MPTTTYTDFTAAVRGISSRTTSAGAAVTDYSAEEDRLAQAILTEGAVTANAFKVNAASGMTVTVGSGAAKTDLYAVAGDVAGQGVYLARLEAATVNVTVPAADAALARTDEIYLIIADAAYDAGSVSLPRLGYRTGTPGGGAPGPDAAWKASVKLASIAVGAAVSSISSGNITDARAGATLSPIANVVDAKGDLLVGTADNAVARKAVGTDGQVLTADATSPDGLRWASASALIGWAQYDPAGGVLKLTSSTTFAALDTTNLRATFVAPPSGAVKLEFGAWGSSNGNPSDGPIVGVLDGSTVKANSGYQGVAGGTGTTFGPVNGVRRISGLTPGATYTYDLAYAASGAVAGNVAVAYGGGVNGYGAAYLFITAV